MRLRTLEPPPPLDDHAAELVHYTEYRPEHTVQRLVPDGCAYLVIELDGMPRRVFDDATLAPVATYRGAWFSGPHRTYRTIEARVDSSMFAIRFRPGGARGVVGRSLAPLVDRIVDAEEVFGPGVRSLREALLRRSADAAFALASDWLLERCAAGPAPDPIVRDAVDGIAGDPAFVRTNLAALAARSGLSPRRFAQRFKDDVGLTPKVFQRVMRFREIVTRIAEGRPVAWAQVSLDCGYYDQAHFVREFRAFCGTNPTAFLRDAVDDRTNFFPVA